MADSPEADLLSTWFIPSQCFKSVIIATQTEILESKADYRLGYVWLISVVAAMGGLLFGWDWVVIGGAKPFFQRYFQLTSEAQIGWANSCALIGCLFGALFAGALSDKLGRKRLLIVAALLFTVTSLGNALATSLRFSSPGAFSAA